MYVKLENTIKMQSEDRNIDVLNVSRSNCPIVNLVISDDLSRNVKTFLHLI